MPVELSSEWSSSQTPGSAAFTRTFDRYWEDRLSSLPRCGSCSSPIDPPAKWFKTTVCNNCGASLGESGQMADLPPILLGSSSSPNGTYLTTQPSPVRPWRLAPAQPDARRAVVDRAAQVPAQYRQAPPVVDPRKVLSGPVQAAVPVRRARQLALSQAQQRGRAILTARPIVR